MEEVSKKLKLDAEGNIQLDDGAEALEDMEKEAEKLNKETQKDLDAKAKDVDDINNAEAKDFKMRDGAGKVLNIKTLKESKLTLDEEEIDEAIPRDLIRSYKYSRYPVDRSVDLQNTEYRELTPEEAMKVVKEKGSKDIRVILPYSDQLITLKDTHGSTNYRTRYVPYADAYEKRTGAKVTDTAAMNASHIFKIAKKIYYIPDSAKVLKDPAMMAKRAENPESINYRGRAGSIDGRTNLMPSKNTTSYYGIGNDIKSIMRYEAELKDLKKRYTNGEIDKENYEATRERYLRYLRRTQREVGDYRTEYARRRNLASELTLHAKIEQFQNLKDEIYRVENRLSKAERELDAAKSSGSVATRQLRDEYAECLRRLKEIQRKAALYELKLEDTDDADTEAIKAAQQAYDNQLSQFNAMRDEINRLLRRN